MYQSTDWSDFESMMKNSRTRPLYTEFIVDTFRLTIDRDRFFTMDVFHKVSVDGGNIITYYTDLTELRRIHERGTALEEGLNELARILGCINEWGFDSL